MKNYLLPLLDKVLLRKRFIIEALFDKLKSTMGLEHTRHRSPSMPSSISSLVWLPIPWHNLRSKWAKSTFLTPCPPSQTPPDLIHNSGFYGERASCGQGWTVSTTGHKQVSFISSSLSPHRLPKFTSQDQISDLLALSTQSDPCWAKVRIYRCVILAFSEALPKFYPNFA